MKVSKRSEMVWYEVWDCNTEKIETFDTLKKAMVYCKKKKCSMIWKAESNPILHCENKKFTKVN